MTTASRARFSRRAIEARAHVIVDIDFVKDGSTKAQFARYRSTDWSKGYDVIIHDECTADVIDKDYVTTVLAPHMDGLPAVNLHCAMHSYRVKSDDWFRFCGIQSSSHGPQEPIEVSLKIPRIRFSKGARIGQRSTRNCTTTSSLR